MVFWEGYPYILIETILSPNDEHLTSYPTFYQIQFQAPITPGQLVGGVATTVNGIIQQLTGNVQPVYQAPYRDPNQYDDDQQNEPIRRRKPNRVYYDSAGAVSRK